MSRYLPLLPVVFATCIVATIVFDIGTAAALTPASEIRKPLEIVAEAEPAGEQTVAVMDQSTRPTHWSLYNDRAHGFSIRHPPGFAVRPRDVAKLAHFKPTPVISVFFMNPTMAAGDLAGTEPPDMELRIYLAGTADSLKTWLTSAGLMGSGAVVDPYRNAGLSGLKICQSTMIAPGCSFYFFHGGRIYQLTPGSREGEAMTNTFAFLP